MCRIALADADPLVASFWMAVFNPKLAPLLAEMTAEARLTLDEWRRIRNAEPRTILGRAFKCLYLNRTNFSGILNRAAGPIGGRAQSGAYDIGCRFPRERLAKRLLVLAKLSPHVTYVRCQDWRTTLAGSELTSTRGLLWYLDPPFWNKADRLYRHYFNGAEHKALANAVRTLKGNWVLPYDMASEVVDLYGCMPGIHHVSMRYTARSRSTPDKSQESLFSNIAVARGMARRSLAVLEGGVKSRYIDVCEGMPEQAALEDAVA